MASLESTGLVPPFLGPELPVYPQIDQTLLVTGPSVGGNVYPAIVQQFVPPLALRSRESAFLWEPNNIPLGPGYYTTCRLIGTYLATGLPLYLITCCSTGAFSSSSAGG